MYNNDEQASLSFKLYDMNQNQYIDLDQRLTFNSDMRLGNGLEPVIFTNTDFMPDDFKISAAYPNPFNPTVSFDITLVEETFVSASVFNLSGQKIAEIHEGNLNQGINTLSWNAMGFASGIYFVNIESGNGLIATQKISLLK